MRKHKPVEIPASSLDCIYEENMIESPEKCQKTELVFEVNGEEFTLMVYDLPEPTVIEPFVISFKPVKIKPGFKGKFKHFSFNPPNSDKSFSITYRVIK